MDRKKQQRFLKGAFIEVPPGGEKVKPIYFQFNPETIERVKSGTWTSAQSQRQKVDDVSSEREFAKLKSKKVKAGFLPSPEKINLSLRLDSTEKALRSAGEADVTEGILPELSAIENLIKKVSTKVSAKGSKKSPTLVRTKEVPLVLFVWGNYRVIPVTILSMTITEQKFDYRLSPVRGEVRVSLQVLEEEDAKLNDRAFSAYRFTEDEKVRLRKKFYDNQKNANKGMDVPLGYPLEL